MPATVEQLATIRIFSDLLLPELNRLQSYTHLKNYRQGEIINHEGERLPAKLYAILCGSLRMTKTATTGKETILRTLSAGEIFAAPALLGDGISPATITAVTDSQIITIERNALLDAIRETPEIALRMLIVFNQRIQLLHDTVHGLVSERAIVRLARFIQYFISEYGVNSTPKGLVLNSNISYYQMARSVGITYEECVRLIKSLKSVISYSRGGKITILDIKALEEIAAGSSD